MTKFAMAAVTVALLASGWGATAATGPEYVGTFEAHTQSGSVIVLERGKARGTYHMLALGYGGVKGLYDIAGAHSPVRIKSNEPITFVVRVESQKDDPVGTIQISALEVKSDKRSLPSVVVGFSSSNKMSAHAIAFHATKLGTEYFTLTPDQPLTTGEYLVSMTLPQDAANAGMRDVYLFGVD